MPTVYDAVDEVALDVHVPVHAREPRVRAAGAPADHAHLLEPAYRAIAAAQ